MKIFSPIFLLLILLTSACQNEQPTQERSSDKPNVLIIFTDDQGSLDMNCYGSEDLFTPNMDALAAGGIRFTQFYSAAPVCSPSRAGLLTGKDPVRAGLPGNVPVPAKRIGAGLPTEQFTIAELLQQQGYKTGHVGKWHLGHIPEKQPNAQGFDYTFGHHVGCIDNYSHFFYWSGPNIHDLWRNGEEVYYPGEFFPDLMVKEVNQFMEENRNDPWLLYWAINVPHYPYQGDEKWLDHYKDMETPRKEYSAFLSTMDEKIGEVLSKLDELGLEEQTLVIFQSDNGHSVEERAFFGGGSAGTFRGAKFSLFEGGIRVPAIIRLPGVVPEGEVRDQMAIAMDWFPTIAEICGVDLPDGTLDGKSLMPVIQNKSTISQHDVLHWHRGQAGNLNAQWAIRQSNWKLIGNPEDPTQKTSFEEADSLFLIDLSKDLSEKENLASQYPEKVQELKQIHLNHLQQMKDK